MRISCSIVRPASRALLAPARAHADVVVRVANSYVAQTQDRWCGPASGLMQLNSPGASVAAMPTQLACPAHPRRKQRLELLHHQRHRPLRGPRWH